MRNAAGECVLVEGAVALARDTTAEQCGGFEQYWYERTAYRKIPYSSCEGGERPDRGTRHACPGLVAGAGFGALVYWVVVVLVSAGAAAGVAYFFYTRKDRG